MLVFVQGFLQRYLLKVDRKVTWHLAYIVIQDLVAAGCTCWKIMVDSRTSRRNLRGRRWANLYSALSDRLKSDRPNLQSL